MRLIFKLSNPDIANNDKNTVSFNEVKITYRITGSIRHVGKETQNVIFTINNEKEGKKRKRQINFKKLGHKLVK